MQDSVNKWLDAGYGLFATQGPEGVNVEKMARILDQTKLTCINPILPDKKIFIAQFQFDLGLSKGILSVLLCNNEG